MSSLIEVFLPVGTSNSPIDKTIRLLIVYLIYKDNIKLPYIQYAVKPSRINNLALREALRVTDIVKGNLNLLLSNTKE